MALATGGNPLFPPNYQPPNRVLLINQGGGRSVEGQAGGTIPVGSLIALNSSSKLVVHPTYGGVAERMFALERAMEPQVGAISPIHLWDSYVNNDWVMAWDCVAGDVVLALMALGQTVTVGDYLMSAGDGTLLSMSGTTTTTTSTTPVPTYNYKAVGVAPDTLNLQTTTTSTTLAAGITAPSNTPFNTVRVRIL